LSGKSFYQTVKNAKETSSGDGFCEKAKQMKKLLKKSFKSLQAAKNMVNFIAKGEKKR